MLLIFVIVDEWAKLYYVPDYVELHAVIVKVAVKWESIGIYLQIRPEILEQIRQDHANHGVVEKCTRVIQTWERNAHPEYTWANLINVLKAPGIEEHALANKLCEELLNRCSC